VRREQIAALNERAVAQIALMRKKRKQAERARVFLWLRGPERVSVRAFFAPFSRLKRHMKFM